MEAQTLDYQTLEKAIYSILDNYFLEKEKKKVANITFNELCQRFFEKAKDKKLSTLSTYLTICDCHIKNSKLGSTLLIDLDNKIFDKYVDDLILKRLSAKRVTDIIVFIKSVLNFAKAEKLIENIDFNIVRPRPQKKDMRVLSVNEQTKLESYIYNHIEDTTNLAVLIALSTGIRIGELCSLRWSDINLELGVIRIRRTIQRIKNLDNDSTKKTILNIDTPKSPSSSRDVPLTSKLLTILKALYKSDLAHYYILSGTDTPLEPRCLQYRFGTLLRVVGIAKANFHALRHTFATRAIEADIDIKTLSELLGHSSVKITLDTYVHSTIEQKLKQIEKMNVA